MHKFVDLCQSSMIVDEYTSKFHRLKHFYPDMYPTEHSWAVKYVKKLNDSLRYQVMMKGTTTLADATQTVWMTIAYYLLPHYYQT